MFKLATNPDGNFYSIPETNELLNNIESKFKEVEESVTTLVEDKYKIEGKAIDENTDLDNIQDSGSYYTANLAITSSLTNAPADINGSFYMIVFKFSANTLIHIIFTATKMYCRRRTTSGFGKWYEYTGTQLT